MCFMILKSNEILIKLCWTSSEPAGNPKLNNAVFYNPKRMWWVWFTQDCEIMYCQYMPDISLWVAEQTELPWL